MCGDGTTAASQYDNPCPLGFVCGPGTTPATQYGLLCPAGFTCSGGVAQSERTAQRVPQRLLLPARRVQPGCDGLHAGCAVCSGAVVGHHRRLLVWRLAYQLWRGRTAPTTSDQWVSARWAPPASSAPQHLDDCYLDPSWTLRRSMGVQPYRHSRRTHTSRRPEWTACARTATPARTS